jgi:SSS family solute:Na+ symporter
MVGWQLAGEPYGVMAIIVGSCISLLTFLIVVWVERRKGIPYAPSAYLQQPK